VWYFLSLSNLLSPHRYPRLGIEFKLYRRAKTWEFLGLAWTKNNGADAPNVLAMIHWSTRMSLWVATEILRGRGAKGKVGSSSSSSAFSSAAAFSSVASSSSSDSSSSSLFLFLFFLGESDQSLHQDCASSQGYGQL
jgi:RasGEF domain